MAGILNERRNSHMAPSSSLIVDFLSRQWSSDVWVRVDKEVCCWNLYQKLMGAGITPPEVGRFIERSEELEYDEKEALSEFEECWELPDPKEFFDRTVNHPQRESPGGSSNTDRDEGDTTFEPVQTQMYPSKADIGGWASRESAELRDLRTQVAQRDAEISSLHSKLSSLRAKAIREAPAESKKVPSPVKKAPVNASLLQPNQKRRKAVEDEFAGSDDDDDD
ncbi:hypothetical protein P7C73_g4132, partial [Tremellales sp. Uapishka_1]